MMQATETPLPRGAFGQQHMSSITAPSVPAPSPSRHRRLLLPVAMLVGILLITSVGAAAAVYRAQQADLSAAQRDRAAALHTLDSALSRAQADGLTLAELQPVYLARRAILAEPQLHAAAFGFDSGERAHVQHQGAELRNLLGQVDRLQAQATDVSRSVAESVLDQMQSAIGTAQQAGLDVSQDTATLAATRAGIAAARSPKDVDTAMIGIADRVAAIQAETAAKISADSALAASRLSAQNALARADRLVAAAQPIAQIQPTITGWVQAIAAQHEALPKAVTKPDFDAVSAAATAAADPIDDVLSSRTGAYNAMASARQAVQDALSYKIDPGDIPARLDAFQAQLDVAATTPQFEAIDGFVSAMIAPLLDRLGIAELGVGKVIVISLARQELSAYFNGQPVYTTLVTTGRPALPTPPGNYKVLRKNHPWEMVSDFPQSSPYWYPPTWVQYTLWFRDDGYAIHDAPWRSTYGPGTEQAGSHGCVNVPMPIMESLYAWADVGTRVIVH
jgi:lipoprotein-anchoring transpeptidase ErfK/SrfK